MLEPHAVLSVGTPRQPIAPTYEEFQYAYHQCFGRGHRASKVIGSTVVNEQNETVGKVDDLIVSGAGKQEPVAVLSVGGFLGVGSKLVAIRYADLKANPDKSDFVLAGATKDSLKSLPDFTYAR